MKMYEIRVLTDEQIEEELEKSYKELMNLRFRDATNQLTDTNQPRKTRKDVARMLTCLRERQTQ
jgi:large subunit ribosomal protein L29